MEAIQGIRRAHPGYFDRIDVRIVTGDPDESAPGQAGKG
jgi:hypothetical protein